MGTGVSGGACEKAKHSRARRMSWCRTSEPSGDLNKQRLLTSPYYESWDGAQESAFFKQIPKGIQIGSEC